MRRGIGARVAGATGVQAWLIAVCLGGCASKQKELENVAKDWCMTIRASQVMPVYPLTQDIQPGDVFLTNRTIEEQQTVWNDRGFLPLDHHLTRLDPTGYENFYDFSYCPPESRPSKFGGKKPGVLSTPLGAAFPSYKFSVRRSGSFGAAFPVKGIPIGLGLMKSHAADGAVDIDEARTLGVDEASLYADLQAWAAGNRALLNAYGSDGARRTYLRVVTRVYQTSKISVSLYDASNFAAGADVAESRPLTAAVAEPPSADGGGDTAARTVQNYQRAIEALNQSLASSQKPGGSVRVASATARSISLDERFDPPLAVGFLAFDCAILEGGSLGPPSPVFARVNGDIAPSALSERPVEIQLAVATKAQYVLLKALSAENAAARDAVASLDALAAALPKLDGLAVRLDMTTRKRIVQRAEFPAGAIDGYLTVLAFDGALQETISVAERVLAGELALPAEVGITGSPEAVAEALRAKIADWRRAADDLARRRVGPEADAARVYRKLVD